MVEAPVAIATRCSSSDTSGGPVGGSLDVSISRVCVCVCGGALVAESIKWSCEDEQTLSISIYIYQAIYRSNKAIDPPIDPPIDPAIRVVIAKRAREMDRRARQQASDRSLSISFASSPRRSRTFFALDLRDSLIVWIARDRDTTNHPQPPIQPHTLTRTTLHMMAEPDDVDALLEAAYQATSTNNHNHNHADGAGDGAAAAGDGAPASSPPRTLSNDEGSRGDSNGDAHSSRRSRKSKRDDDDDEERSRKRRCVRVCAWLASEVDLDADRTLVVARAAARAPGLLVARVIVVVAVEAAVEAEARIEGTCASTSLARVRLVAY